MVDAVIGSLVGWLIDQLIDQLVDRCSNNIYTLLLTVVAKWWPNGWAGHVRRVVPIVDCLLTLRRYDTF